MKKPREGNQPNSEPMAPKLLIAIVASAVFAGFVAGLFIISHPG